MKNLLTVLFLILFSSIGASAQYTTLNAHSHNDYEQKQPFYMAYSAHFGSIEADIWVVNKDLLVAHNKSDLSSARSLDSLYILPIVQLFRKNGGKAWSDHPSSFQLMIDLKTAAEPALSMLVEKLSRYPDVFDPKVNKHAVRIVITGNRPEPADFGKYPPFIFFDGNINRRYNRNELKRVGLYSENLAQFTSWKGMDGIPGKEEQRLRQIIDSVHHLDKKIRFWNAPDSPFAWKTLINLKVDYLNTDHIGELERYLESF